MFIFIRYIWTTVGWIAFELSPAVNETVRISVCRSRFTPTNCRIFNDSEKWTWSNWSVVHKLSDNIDRCNGDMNIEHIFWLINAIRFVFFMAYLSCAFIMCILNFILLDLKISCIWNCLAFWNDYISAWNSMTHKKSVNSCTMSAMVQLIITY